MIKQIAITAAALAAVSAAVITPATADEVGIGVGPVGVTVGTSHGPYYDGDRYVVRERRVYREREPDETVVVRRQYRDEPRRRVIIERDDD
ncbi:hypothetical protein [Rhodopseudomonas sp. BR0M22]|uniref:hypothetical protein n=1 Tax=Rhodopseudomonas sp. BR0M22 TaxID=2269369 RepID=UPI0013DFAE57|nr:hypothetical protein [Rhodopseudomonas sp. BR0M22]MCD0417131.1 hypothetical protein [Rubrivivax sp. JA1024]NEW93661.1 hypothetical protein [Rhodopseudomonas sp. BR0M22]